MQKILISFFYCLLLVLVPVAYADTPLWSLAPTTDSHPTQTVSVNETVTLQYLVQNNTRRVKSLTIKPLSGVTQLSACLLGPKGQSNSSCLLRLSINGSAVPIEGIHGGPFLCQTDFGNKPNLNQCYQPAENNVLNINRSTGPGTAIISSQPTKMNFAINTITNFTITNSASSTGAAQNIIATIPPGSNFIVQNNTCGASLAIGASCVISFTTNAIEGPTDIPIAGTNTNTIEVELTSVTQPIISITGPSQQLRVVQVSNPPILELTVANDLSSSLSALGITVTNKTSCSGLMVDDTDCIIVTPGSSCVLKLTSNTPYAPCTITVAASNSISVTTPIAFFHAGGLVFETFPGGGKVIADLPQGFSSSWTKTSANITGATDPDLGAVNTTAITLNSSCASDAGSCAAQFCRNMGAVWYLPAVNELGLAGLALCTNFAIPCNFGGFVANSYYSSTQQTPSNAFTYVFPAISLSNTGKGNAFPVRCVSAFVYP